MERILSHIEDASDDSDSSEPLQAHAKYSRSGANSVQNPGKESNYDISNVSCKSAGVFAEKNYSVGAKSQNTSAIDKFYQNGRKRADRHIHYKQIRDKTQYRSRKTSDLKSVDSPMKELDLNEEFEDEKSEEPEILPKFGSVESNQDKGFAPISKQSEVEIQEKD